MQLKCAVLVLSALRVFSSSRIMNLHHCEVASSSLQIHDRHLTTKFASLDYLKCFSSHNFLRSIADSEIPFNSSRQLIKLDFNFDSLEFKDSFSVELN